jgi:hypothetical protein
MFASQLGRGTERAASAISSGHIHMGIAPKGIADAYRDGSL